IRSGGPEKAAASQQSFHALAKNFSAFHGVARRAGSRATPRCEGWPRRREIECPRPALSSALTSCAFVSFVVKAMPQQTTPRYTNQYAFRRSDAAANRDFEPGFEGPTGVGASISMFCASLHLFLPVTANYLPVMAKSSPCYRPVPRAPPIFLKALLLKLIFLQKPGRRPPILPVFCLLSGSIRENRGAKPLFNPGLILPSSLPSKLGWSPGDLRCVNALAHRGGGNPFPASFPPSEAPHDQDARSRRSRARPSHQDRRGSSPYRA